MYFTLTCDTKGPSLVGLVGEKSELKVAGGLGGVGGGEWDSIVHRHGESSDSVQGSVSI